MSPIASGEPCVQRRPSRRKPSSCSRAAGSTRLSNTVKWFAPGSSTLGPADQAEEIAATSPIDPAKETVSFCNTGHWAATNWFAMSEVLGQKNVKLYAGSMVEWSQDPNGLPMANVPSRTAQLLQDAKAWTAKTFK